ARLDRAYQVGFLAPVADDEDTDLDDAELVARHAPGAARRQLAELTEEQRAELLATVVETFGGKPEDYAEASDAYLLGIKNIQAEALAYDQQIRAKADG